MTIPLILIKRESPISSDELSLAKYLILINIISTFSLQKNHTYKNRNVFGNLKLPTWKNMLTSHHITINSARELLVLILAIQFSSELSAKSDLNESYDDRFTSFTLDVCIQIVNTSKQALLHVVYFDNKLPVGHFMQTLHENSILTVLISNLTTFKNSIKDHHPKNFLFFVENFSEIFGLILGSVSQPEEADKKFGPSKNVDASYPKIDKGIPKYCIEDEEHKLIIAADSLGSCDYHLRITTAEIQDKSILTDHVLKHTRGFSLSKIWNFKNYIIFLLPNSQYPRFFNESLSGQKTQPRSHPSSAIQEFYRTLLFAFRFFWRFFNGSRVLVCTGYACFKFAPFAQKVVKFNGGQDDIFFNFSNPVLHTYDIYSLAAYESGDKSEKVFTWFIWSVILQSAIATIPRSTNLAFTIETLYELPNFRQKVDSYFQRGVGLYAEPAGFAYEEEDLSLFDYTVAIDTCTVCIATPRPGFKPQVLAPFHCFSPLVWVALVVTIATILGMQYLFQYAQRTSFRGLYSEREIIGFEETPVALTVFEYFVCGRPAR